MRQKPFRKAGHKTQVKRDSPGLDGGRLEPQLGRLPVVQATGVLTPGWEDPSFNSTPALPDETRQDKTNLTKTKDKITGPT